VKYKDDELLGVPWIVVVGRGWADGAVELRDRFSGQTRELAVGAALATDITAVISGNRA
jgi:prolyl-tRNA synthetase